MSSSFVSPVAVRAPRLLDQLRDAALHRFGRPEPADRYAGWARRYILFHGKRHPRELGECEVRKFLEHVAKSEKNPVTTMELYRYAPCKKTNLFLSSRLAIGLITRSGIR
jgi:hypothetical protein